MSSKQTDPGYIADKDALSARLKRFVDDPAERADRLLEQHAAHCVIGPEDPAVRAEKTGEMMAAVGRLMGRS